MFTKREYNNLPEAVEKIRFQMSPNKDPFDNLEEDNNILFQSPFKEYEYNPRSAVYVPPKVVKSNFFVPQSTLINTAIPYYQPIVYQPVPQPVYTVYSQPQYFVQQPQEQYIVQQPQYVNYKYKKPVKYQPVDININVNHNKKSNNLDNFADKFKEITNKKTKKKENMKKEKDKEGNSIVNSMLNPNKTQLIIVDPFSKNEAFMPASDQANVVAKIEAKIEPKIENPVGSNSDDLGPVVKKYSPVRPNPEPQYYNTTNIENNLGVINNKPVTPVVENNQPIPKPNPFTYEYLMPNNSVDSNLFYGPEQQKILNATKVNTGTSAVLDSIANKIKTDNDYETNDVFDVNIESKKSAAQLAADYFNGGVIPDNIVVYNTVDGPPKLAKNVPNPNPFANFERKLR